MHMIIKLGLLLPFLAACATQPNPLRNAQVASIDTVTARSAPQSVKGSRVRWGGTIVKVDNRKHETLIEVLARPLFSDGEPNDRKEGMGRFIAKIPGFIDPADYKTPNRLTVVGVLDGVSKGRVGESYYTFPVVRVEHHQMWRGERYHTRSYDSYPHFWWGIGSHHRHGGGYIWSPYPYYW